MHSLQDKILPPNGFRMTTNPDEEANYVSLLMADGLRRRNVGSITQLGPIHDKTTIPTHNVVNYAPTRENQLKFHTLNNVGQAMIIRFAVDSSSENPEDGKASVYGEFVDLCVLKLGANGVLEISPDFTNNRKPYTIELEHKKETYEYWIEHVSPVMDYDEQLRESVMQNEVFARHVQVLRYLLSINLLSWLFKTLSLLLLLYSFLATLNLYFKKLKEVSQPLKTLNYLLLGLRWGMILRSPQDDLLDCS